LTDQPDLDIGGVFPRIATVLFGDGLLAVMVAGSAGYTLSMSLPSTAAPSSRRPPGAGGWTLGVSGPGRLAFFPRERAPAAEGGFVVETVYTGLSAGTELSYVKGTHPALSRAWDAGRAVFDGDGTGLGFPVRRMGYMEVGQVTETRSPSVPVGARLAMRYGHADGHTAAADEFAVALPEELDPVLGVFVAHMGPICANGVLHAAAEERRVADPDLADGVRDRSVLVVGGGVVGLLTGLFARHHGAAEVAVADPTPERLTAAARLGLTPVDETACAPWRWAKDRWVHGPGDCGADVVFQCRGRGEALAGALRSLRPQRTVIDLAFYQGGAEEVRLGEEFHHNGLGIRCAQIGRVPRGTAGSWDRRRLAEATIDLLCAHALEVRSALVTDVVPVGEAPDVVADLAARRRHALQVVFTCAPVSPSSASGHVPSAG
jgi:threonine dehydrogenase-like Zn-dependent dehydrogenase